MNKSENMGSWKDILPIVKLAAFSSISRKVLYLNTDGHCMLSIKFIKKWKIYPKSKHDSMMSGIFV